MEEKNPIDLLLSPENTDNIVLYDEEDKPTEFEQIAIIPLNNTVYAILKPVEEMPGIAEDEAIVFEMVEDEENGDLLNVVSEEDVVNQVFEEYKKLVAEEDKGE